MGDITIHRFEASEWHVPVAPGADPTEAEAAGEQGARRRFLAQGDAGFYSQVVRIPADFESPSHSHDHAEVFMILEGGGTVAGEQLGQYDTVVVPAGADYGFRAGSEGLLFLVVRGAAASYTNAST